MTNIEVQNILNKSGEFLSIRPSKNPALHKRGLDWGFDFQMDILGELYQMTIGFKEEFPFLLPTYLIDFSFKNPGYLPHVETDGYVCYAHESELIVNPLLPLQILNFTINAVRNTIVAGLQQVNFIDFVNEWEAYWRNLPEAKTISANIKIDSEPQIIKIYLRNDNLFAISDRKDTITEFQKFGKKEKITDSVTNGLYIPLEISDHIIPPNINTKLNLLEIKALIFNNQSKKNIKALGKLLNRVCKSNELVLLSFKQPNGNHAVFGVKFEKINSRLHPLIDPDAKANVVPLVVKRLDKDYMVRRGGLGNNAFENKGIIIGCGALGSVIAEELIKAGVQNLTLIDPDNLTNDNIYRHVAGFHRIGQNKAEALKLKFELYYPHANISANSKNILQLIRNKSIKFNEFDFIIIATGNPSINLYLNKHINKNAKGIPTFFTWIEPYGLGGHCLVSNIVESGCYNCLYNNTELFNSASFVDKEQKVAIQKSISGCGSLYTPYGSLDAYQTGILTVRRIISTLNGEIKVNSIFSWKGDAKAFRREGLNTSPRFELSDFDLEKSSNLFIDYNCPICSQIT